MCRTAFAKATTCATTSSSAPRPPGIRLIISVDMGIRAFAPAETAQRLGVDLIVTDHHLPGPDGVPTGAGGGQSQSERMRVSVQAALRRGRGVQAGAGTDASGGWTQRFRTKLLMSFMKVVAIATIADAVPLTGENRVFASLGLDGLRKAVNPGLKALLEVAQISTKRPPTSGEVAFRIAPRINAAGRMDVARDVIELFSVKDPARARELAAKLDQLNTDRQEEERRILRAVDERFAGDPTLREAYCIVIDGEGWHRGVIGITATRVVERYNRPALVISRDGEEAFGSGRSIRAFHSAEALESCGLFSRAMADTPMPADSPCLSANVEELRAKLDAFARTRLTLADFDPMLDLDAELASGRHHTALVPGARIAGALWGGKSRAGIFCPRCATGRTSADSEREAHQAESEGRSRSEGTFGGGDPCDPTCHPDGAAIRREEKAAAVAEINAVGSMRTGLDTGSDFEIKSPSMPSAGTWPNVLRDSASGRRFDRCRLHHR